MKEVITEYYCDICGKKKEELNTINYPVIMHTEEEEGKTVSPYVHHKMMEVCRNCMNKILVVHGYGARGVYNYYIDKIEYSPNIPRDQYEDAAKFMD